MPDYPLRTIVARTGLTPELLRAWERRYGVVRPRRSRGGQRRYSEADLHKLTLLRQATSAGHQIGILAGLDDAELARVARRARVAEGRRENSVGGEPDVHGGAHRMAEVLRPAFDAIERYDGPALERILRSATVTLGATILIDRLISLLLHEIGERWHAGRLSPAHEHLASSVIRRTLTWIAEASAPDSAAPAVVVATPQGEPHELGAALAHAVASTEGWRVIYLGADLPAEDIVQAARRTRARLIALSLVQSRPGAGPLREVRRLATLVPRRMDVVIGGVAALPHERELETIGIRYIRDMPAFRAVLHELSTERAA